MDILNTFVFLLVNFTLVYTRQVMFNIFLFPVFILTKTVVYTILIITEKEREVTLVIDRIHINKFLNPVHSLPFYE